MTTNRPLRVFLCHSSSDKPIVRELCQKLRAEAWIEPWLDEEELYPGQDWNFEIEKAVEAVDVILVCLSKGSTSKEGYVQREIRIALDYADYKPEGTLYVIPVRLEECEPPRRLRVWQYADYFEGQRERGFQKLLVSLKKRADGLGLNFEEPSLKAEEKSTIEMQVAEETPQPASTKSEVKPAKKRRVTETPKPKPIATPPNKITLSNGMELMLVPAGEFWMGSDTPGEFWEKPQHSVDIPYDYWVARFPVTNELYNPYVSFKSIEHPVRGWEMKKDHPVTDVKWTYAMQYCQWLNSQLKNELSSDLVLRLPTEAEWEKAARGTDGRDYPWGDILDTNKCNTYESGKVCHTTPVGSYSPQGDSPYGCTDMVGNVWEWTHSLMGSYPYSASDGRESEKASGYRVLRGGSCRVKARCSSRIYGVILNENLFGFRVVAAPKFS